MTKKIIAIKFNLYATPDVETEEEAIEEASILLEQVAEEIKKGFKSGYYPSWDLEIS